MLGLEQSYNSMEKTMKLPAVIDTYFAADDYNQPEVLNSLFTAEAVVADEQKSYEGIDAITAWWAAAKVIYGHKTEPLDAVEADGVFLVHARVTGRFPGSPITLTYRFLLEKEKISTLEIG